MIPIAISELDCNLVADLDGASEGWKAFEAPYEGATVGNQRWHVVFNDIEQRGGIVFVGSGSSGHTEWTDAGSPDEVLKRLLTGELLN